ncbi:hypothetical protein Tco_0021557, partial [Tanacetum coccineum]
EVVVFYKRLDVPTRQVLDSQGPIMSHNGTNGRRRVVNNSAGLAAITIKLDKLGRDITKVTERVHAVQVGCDIYRQLKRDI